MTADEEATYTRLSALMCRRRPDAPRAGAVLVLPEKEWPATSPRDRIVAKLDEMRQREAAADALPLPKPGAMPEAPLPPPAPVVEADAGEEADLQAQLDALRERRG